jgi:hypothetical protein
MVTVIWLGRRKEDGSEGEWATCLKWRCFPLGGFDESGRWHYNMLPVGAEIQCFIFVKVTYFLSEVLDRAIV